MLIEDRPAEFPDPLQVFQIVVIDQQIEDRGWLEIIGFAGAIAWMRS